jgi:hypothetical protein
VPSITSPRDAIVADIDIASRIAVIIMLLMVKLLYRFCIESVW